MHLSTVAILNEYDYIKSSLKNRRINSERLVAILNEYDYIKSWLRPGDRVEIFSNVAILNEYDYIKRKNKRINSERSLSRNTQRVRLYQKH